MKRINPIVLAAVFSSLVLSGCSQPEPPAQAGGPGAMPPQPIDVAQVISAEVVDWAQFTTRLEAPRQVELRPRVSGVIESIEFTEGALVKKGDLLVKLDARPFEAEVARQEAEVASAQAALDQAKLEAERATSLRSSKAISTEAAQARQFLASQRLAELASAEAELKTARLNLAYTRIKAPISGRVSRAFITEGNTVAAGTSALTSLVSTRQVHAYFDVDERTWNQTFGDITADSQLPVYLQLSGDADFSHKGTLDFIDNQVNTNTGTLRVRAAFQVDSPQLRPGAFARVRLAPTKAVRHVLVPERSIGTDLKYRFVLTVDENNTLQFRPVTLGHRIGDLRVVTSGLTDADRIAANGPARVGPGMPVAPTMVEIDTSFISDAQPANQQTQTAGQITEER